MTNLPENEICSEEHAEAIAIIHDQIRDDEHCDAAKYLIQEFLHGELDESVMDCIRVHLATCEDCMDEYELEQLISELVKRCNPPSRASAELKVRIVSSLRITKTIN